MTTAVQARLEQRQSQRMARLMTDELLDEVKLYLDHPTRANVTRKLLRAVVQNDPDSNIGIMLDAYLRATDDLGAWDSPNGDDLWNAECALSEFCASADEIDKETSAAIESLKERM